MKTRLHTVDLWEFFEFVAKQCRSIFQIDSVNHGSTLPLEMSDRMVGGLPLHAHYSKTASLKPVRRENSALPTNNTVPSKLSLERVTFATRRQTQNSKR